jgi:two-component system, OmpR family, response regulator TctD
MARILVADDQVSIQRAIQRALERDGHDIILAVDGLEAARVIREDGADLALIDINMPKMSGIELLAAFKATAPAMPVVVMSGGDRDQGMGLLEATTSMGATGILAKPFTLGELRAAVSRALAPGGRTETG